MQRYLNFGLWTSGRFLSREVTRFEIHFRKNILASGLKNGVRQRPGKYLETMTVVYLSVWVKDSED